MARVSTHLILAVVVLMFAASSGYLFLYYTSPQSVKLWQLSLWYLAVFLTVASLSLFLGYSLRTLFWRQGSRYEFLKSAQRQAILLGFLGVIALIFQAAKVLNLWTSILLFVIFLLIELYAQ